MYNLFIIRAVKYQWSAEYVKTNDCSVKSYFHAKLLENIVKNVAVKLITVFYPHYPWTQASTILFYKQKAGTHKGFYIKTKQSF